MTTLMTNTSFTSFSARSIPLIDQKLDALLTFNFQDSRSILEAAIRHSALAPAKRIRPLLVLAMSNIYSRPIDEIVGLACAIEMVHCYSLIHDDLPAMDDDDLRRGQPTCHRKFDEATAILAGDTLNTFCFEVASRELRPHFNSETILNAIEMLAHAFGANGMAGGQVLDLNGERDLAPDKMSQLIKIHSLKTGALLSACVTVPAHLYELPSEHQNAWAKFGRHLGLLFQIVDDIIDVTSSSEILGKTANKDATQSKLTYVSICGLDSAKKLAKQEADAALYCLNQVGKSDSVMKSLVEYILNRNK